MIFNILRVGGQCAIHGILELWLFNKTIIESLKKDKILSDIGKRPTFRYNRNH